MIKALLDTNVLIDYIVPYRPGSECARRIIEAAGSSRFEAIVSAGSLKDVYYLVRKHASDEVARACLSALMDLAEVAAVDRTACALALKSSEPDFEDGIVRVLAETGGADFIVTRDKTAFADSTCHAVEPLLFADAVCRP